MLTMGREKSVGYGNYWVTKIKGFNIDYEAHIKELRKL